MKTLKNILIICGLFVTIFFIACEDLFENGSKEFTVYMKNQSNYTANLYMEIFFSDNSGKVLSYEEFQVPDTEVASLGTRFKDFSFPFYSDKENKDIRSYYGNFYAAKNGVVKASLKDVILGNKYITLVWTGAELKIE